MRIRTTLLLVLPLLQLAARASAQPRDTVAPTPAAPPARISTGVVPDTVTVGEPFTALIRVAADPGARVTLRLVSDSGATVQPLEAATITTDTTATSFVQRLVAWRTGQAVGPEVIVRVAPPEGPALQYRVALRVPYVRTVLPADTGALAPKPAKAPFGAPALAWRIATILALLLATALAAWARARTIERTTSHPAPDPRAEALTLLRRAHGGGFLEAGDWAAFYSLVSEALRVSLAARSTRWARDLTTLELEVESARDGAIPAPVLAVLERADRVKFAAAVVAPTDAEADWCAAEAWVRSDAEVEENAHAAASGTREEAS